MDNPNISEDLLKRIRNKRRSIRLFLNDLKPKATRLTNINIICGAIATLLTAVPAVGGKTVIEALGGTNPDSDAWRIPFAIAALFSLLSTIAANLYKSQDIASRFGKAEVCDAKLEGLETFLRANQIAVKDATEKYTQYITEIPFVSTDSGRLLGKYSSLDKVKGEILEPQSNQAVDRTFHCSIAIEDLESGCHLWLAVEIKGQFWPKERELHLEENGTWKGGLREGSEGAVFSLCLLAADDKAHQQIESWRDRGLAANAYEAFRLIPGTRVIASIDGLHRK